MRCAEKRFEGILYEKIVHERIKADGTGGKSKKMESSQGVHERGHRNGARNGHAEVQSVIGMQKG